MNTVQNYMEICDDETYISAQTLSGDSAGAQQYTAVLWIRNSGSGQICWEYSQTILKMKYQYRNYWIMDTGWEIPEKYWLEFPISPQEIDTFLTRIRIRSTIDNVRNTRGGFYPEQDSVDPRLLWPSQLKKKKQCFILLTN